MSRKLIFSQELINKSNIKHFINIYAKEDNWHKLDKNKGGLGYGWIHYALIRIIKPKKVLCVGSKWGFIPAICALACKDNGKGIVEFVDAGFDMKDYNGPGEHWGGMGWWKKCEPKKYFGKYALERHIKLYVMRSSEFAQKNGKFKYGYVHIDGDHSYRGIKYDFETFWPKVTSGGFLAIHDIGSPDKYGNMYGTRKIWKEIKKCNKYKIIEINEDPGVGIIQKD